jgi:hypothetical protein
MRYFYLIIVFVFCFTLASLAQGKQQLLFRIIDIETKKPVPYATIRFENSRNGTVANVLGDFRIPMRYKKENDILIVSCIGYSTKRIVLSSLTEKTYHSIFLSPKTEQLSPVILNSKKKKRLSAREIVKKAIIHIKDNNPLDPFSYIAYYRDYQFVDEKYINLNEGIVEVFDQGFLTHKISNPDNKSSLYSYQLNTEFAQDTLLSNTIYNDSKQIKDGRMGTSIGNELTLLDIHNPIRNYASGSFSFVCIFEKDFVKNHSFTNKGIIYLDDEELYKIEFSAKDNLTGVYHKANGYIYISKEDFAIHRFDYKLYTNSPKKSIFTVDVEYKRSENDKMYLNYITFNNNFYVIEEGALEVIDFGYDASTDLFEITFNRPIDPNSIERKKSVKLYFKDKKLSINDIYLDTPTTLKIELTDNSINFLDRQNFLSYKLKRNIRDVTGFEIDKSKVQGYQFRELFVQQVFPNTTSQTDLFYIDKAKSLREASINNFDADDYWLNSPLKTTDN